VTFRPVIVSTVVPISVEPGGVFWEKAAAFQGRASRKAKTKDLMGFLLGESCLYYRTMAMSEVGFSP
jgi:hypothetical protein